MAVEKQVAVKLVRSLIGRSKRQKATLCALGLRKINQTVLHADRPQVRGMINTVQHVVEVTEA